MIATSTNAPTKELLTDLYKNMKMGAQSIIDLMPKVKDENLRTEMTAELNRYEEFSKDIATQLTEAGGTPKEENPVAKLAAKMGMAMNTMTDSTTSHLAQMMIEGATMGVTENTKLIREYENKHCSEKALSTARKSVKFMEDTVKRMKQYL